MIGYYKEETAQRTFEEVNLDICIIYNKLLKKTGKWYYDVPPRKLTSVINHGTYAVIKPYKFLFGQIHESHIKFVK